MFARKGFYADPRSVSRIEDCYFYHSMDIPGFGRVEGDWDLTAAARVSAGRCWRDLLVPNDETNGNI